MCKLPCIFARKLIDLSRASLATFQGLPLLLRKCSFLLSGPFELKVQTKFQKKTAPREMNFIISRIVM